MSCFFGFHNWSLWEQYVEEVNTWFTNPLTGTQTEPRRTTRHRQKRQCGKCGYVEDEPLRRDEP